MRPAHVVGATVIHASERDPSKLGLMIENGRITRLGVSSAHGERLDVEGLTMTPGLIDAHVHLGLSSPIQPHFSSPPARGQTSFFWNGNPLEDPELFSDPTNAVLVIQAGRIVKDLR